MRTPLGKVRGLGSAKEGTDHFWRQRLTAIANIPLIVFFVCLIVSRSQGNTGPPVFDQEIGGHPLVD